MQLVRNATDLIKNSAIQLVESTVVSLRSLLSVRVSPSHDGTVTESLKKVVSSGGGHNRETVLVGDECHRDSLNLCYLSIHV